MAGAAHDFTMLKPQQLVAHCASSDHQSLKSTSGMHEPAAIVHVTFGVSRAETVRDALAEQGCAARVIALQSALDFGPIDPPDPDIRQRWVRTVLCPESCDECREPEEPWAEATATGIHVVYWVCMSDAAEQASFLEFAFRMNGRPFHIVDGTDLAFITRDGVSKPWSLAIMRCEDIVKSRLKDRRRPFTCAECEDAAAAWARLKHENAPLRVVRDGRLVSARLTHFDASLVTSAEVHWEVAAMVIGRALQFLFYDVDPAGRGVSDIVLFGRLQALGHDGDLEIRGLGPGLRDYEVRLPAPSPVEGLHQDSEPLANLLGHAIQP